MNSNTHQNTITIMVNFLNSINVPVLEKKLPDDTFLPGLSVLGNSVLMDRSKLKYPGDLLHEAGHIAITEEEMRPFIGTAKMRADWPTDGEEIATILWSYAASFFLNLDLRIVFHPNGYKENSEWLIEEFTNKNYMGLPLLEWMSLCDKEEFPKMKKWLR